jgi:hypothetical protein
MVSRRGIMWSCPLFPLKVAYIYLQADAARDTAANTAKYTRDAAGRAAEYAQGSASAAYGKVLDICTWYAVLLWSVLIEGCLHTVDGFFSTAGK